VRVGRISEKVIDLHELLLAIIEECALLLDCEAASVAVYDAQSNDLIFTVASGQAGEALRQWRMKMDEGILGWVATNQTSFFTNDPGNEKLWCDRVDKTTGYNTRNLAAVPMIRKGILVGVLETINCRKPEGMRPSDLELMCLFADQAGLAIENQRLIAAKQESDRLAIFGVALADIGHNVKNILMRMQFPVTLLDQGIEAKDWRILEGCWPTMRRAIGEIGELVRDMLNYSKNERPALAAVDVSHLAGEVAQQCRVDAQSKNIALELDCPRNLMWTLDEKMLRHGLHNLVGNAIEAIAEHGGTNIRLTVDAESCPGTLRISVSDDGPGIPEEVCKHIFDPFFTTKKAKGTGLGLANVKKNVEAHGGRVLVQTAPGAGASFTLSYPEHPTSA
jgi:signal transduction histidine kinase